MDLQYNGKKNKDKDTNSECQNTMQKKQIKD